MIAAAPTVDRMLTPPQVAARLGVDVHRVLAWVRAAELPAVNLASRGSSRPRYRIDPAALAEFLVQRTVQPPAPRKKKRRAAPVVPRYV
jgi:hypothetical protein